jgi:hypothetical protein
MLLRLVILFAATVAGCASPIDSVTKTHVQTSLVPSTNLLRIVGVSEYQPTKEIKIAAGAGETLATSGQIGQCENVGYLPLKASANIKNVSTVIDAIETEHHTKQKRILTLNNDGGLAHTHGYFSAGLDMREHNGGVSNIWVFFFAEGKVYANAAQIRCQVIIESFNN